MCVCVCVWGGGGWRFSSLVVTVTFIFLNRGASLRAELTAFTRLFQIAYSGN